MFIWQLKIKWNKAVFSSGYPNFEFFDGIQFLDGIHHKIYDSF